MGKQVAKVEEQCLLVKSRSDGDSANEVRVCESGRHTYLHVMGMYEGKLVILHISGPKTLRAIAGAIHKKLGKA